MTSSIPAIEQNIVPLAERAASPGVASQKIDPMRVAARQFEASFLAEMLKHTGLGKMGSEFNGGPGEQAFSGFLVHEYATKISESRSVGLADQIYRALLEREQT